VSPDGPIGFVGLGEMGGRMAGRLLAAGHALAVYDTDEAARSRAHGSGAQICASVREVADVAGTVLVSLPTPAIVREVACGADGLLGGSALHTYVDLSTTGVETAEAVAATLSAAGLRCVDAPVSGGIAGAQAGTLTVMVSGVQAAVADVRPLLEVIGGNVFVVGEHPGAGQLAKVINNLLSATAILVTAEATALAVKGGLDPAVLLDAIAVSSGSNTAVTDKFPRQVLTRRFEQGFRLELMAKDVRLCLDAAQRVGAPMLTSSVIGSIWELGVATLPAGADCTELAKLVEEWAGVTIEAAP
jgi:3-hydroxyisobutyrate dehydrogenase-like beta-hydroxyacid dehydrogenase